MKKPKNAHVGTETLVAHPSGRFKLPVYDSIAACSAATGIPVAALKFAKRNGCQAFEHSRVTLGEFLKWYFAQDGTGQNWDDKFKEFRARREEQKFHKTDGKTISTEDAVMAGVMAISVFNRVMRQRFCNELPAVLKGLDEIAIRNANEKAVETALTECKETWDSEIEKAKERDEVDPVVVG